MSEDSLRANIKALYDYLINYLNREEHSLLHQNVMAKWGMARYGISRWSIANNTSSLVLDALYLTSRNDFELTKEGKGIRLLSPSGIRYPLAVDDHGNIMVRRV
ncbi:MAG: hypothetical protein QXX95_00780 [Nitrososphaerales archaeon]